MENILQNIEAFPLHKRAFFISTFPFQFNLRQFVPEITNVIVSFDRLQKVFFSTLILYFAFVTSFSRCCFDNNVEKAFTDVWQHFIRGDFHFNGN